MYFTASEDENKGYAASCLAGIAVTQHEVGLMDEAALTMNRALETARAVETDNYRCRALREIAVAQTRIGGFAAARQTLDEIVLENHRHLAQIDIAVIQARAGCRVESIRTAESALVDRGRVLEELAKVFAEMGDRDGLKRLLQPCSSEPATAYRLTVLLTRLYPQYLKTVAEFVARGDAT